MRFKLFRRPPTGGGFKGKRHTLEKKRQMSESSKGQQSRKGRLLLNVYELIKLIKLEKSK